MARAPDLAEVFEPPEEIIQAALNGDLVFFVGAGASMLVNLPSWRELAQKVLEELRSAGFINYSEKDQLLGLADPKKQLSIARLIAEENDYQIKFESYLTGVAAKESIYSALNDIGCSCITTNYDELLSPQYRERRDSTATSVPVNRVWDREKFLGKLLNEPGTVVHLHGSIENPESMIVSTADYLEHYDHENVQEFLGELFEKKIVLFLGYGMEEAEILEQILRRGRARKSTERRRFAIQGFFNSERPLYENLHRYYERSFGVHLLGFERDKENYRALEKIVRAWATRLEVRKPPLAVDAEFMDQVLGDD